MTEVQQLILFGVLLAGVIGVVWLQLVRAVLAALRDGEGRDG